MQYILVINGQVVWGPVEWNRRIFELEIETEAGISTSLPDRKPDASVITIGDGIRIMPVAHLNRPSYHLLAETLEGPFWTFGDVAECEYRVVPLPVEQAKPNFKQSVATLRWKQEFKKVTIDIKGNTVEVSAARDVRDQWGMLYAVGIPKTWKFGSVWLELDREDFLNIATAIDTYIQSLYDEELRLSRLIDEATTTQDLIDIESDPTIKEWSNNG